MNTLKYKGYIGTIEYNHEDRLMHGSVIGIKGVVSYEGCTGEDLEKDFRDAVDDYLEMCETEGMKPQKPFKGSLSIRMSHVLHENLAIKASMENKTINGVINDALISYLSH
ncbi:MAG: type II toxin-antitoxin system HicB family antitoxin [Cytophagales bacterium]|nr:type II toxin-antitoxin system HicB family antitoxin [Cytophagales bacterium]